MKKIKSLICILLTLGIMLFICSKPDAVFANNHTLCTVTSFGFIDHHARVNVDFMGYENTTILRVDVKIEKQDFLFFTETVVSASYDSQGETYQNEFFYPIFEDGVYNCTVTYTVTNGDSKDLITFSDTQTYINSDHTEHTHVWNREVTEPTCTKEGEERKFCYCGKAETSVLEKLPHTPGNTYIKHANSMVEGSYYLSYLCVNCSATAKTTIDNSEVSYTNSVNILDSYKTSSNNNCTHFGAPCNLSGNGRCTRATPSCKNGKIFGTPCNLSGKCVGGSCLIPTR